MNARLAQLTDWLEDRTGYRGHMAEALYEDIPGGSRWRYVWGSTLVFTFTVQMITGLVLWMGYSPSETTAWESVNYIQNEMSGGWLLRGIHHFTAQAMIVLMGLHLMQVVIDRAYQAPREVNFWLGLILMQIVLGLSLTGYLLPWDQKGYWATRVATNLMGIVPLVGPQLQELVVGGSDYNHHTVTRFFALHAGVLPALLVVFLVAHIYVFRRHGITAKLPTRERKNPGIAVALAIFFGPLGMFYSSAVGAVVVGLGVAAAARLLDGPSMVAALGGLWILGIAWAAIEARTWRPIPNEHFWPDQVLKDAVACLAVLATVVLLSYYMGAETSAPADGAREYSAARPEWYFLFLFQFLKLFEGYGELGELVGAIVIPGLVMLLLFAMPFIGRSKAGHWVNVIVVLALLGGAAYLTYEAIEEDHGNPDYKNARWVAHESGQLSVELADLGIPPEGAKHMMRTNPKSLALRAFTDQCLQCHSYADAKQHGFVVKDPSAPNLYGFGTPAWIEGLLDPELVDGPNYFGATTMKEGEMVDFVKTTFGEDGDLTREDAQKIAAALAAESGYPSNEKLATEGREIISNYCVDCHKFRDEGDLGSYPDLTGWGSREWLIGMISNPGGERFYVHLAEEDQKMPAFGKEEDAPGADGLDAEVIGYVADYLRGELFKNQTTAHKEPQPKTGVTTDGDSDANAEQDANENNAPGEQPEEKEE